MCDSIFLKEWLDLRFLSLKDIIMSEVSDKLAEIEASQDAAIARVREDVDAQQAEIDELKKRVTSSDDLATLDRIKAKNDALDPIKAATLPEEGTTPGPTA